MSKDLDLKELVMKLIDENARLNKMINELTQGKHAVDLPTYKEEKLIADHTAEGIEMISKFLDEARQ
mgnify:CR=1 FL=1|tara:strand:+ start:249 stop:449 length:201 start_codon:yes stop_codon:yes gene_type:complete